MSGVSVAASAAAGWAYVGRRRHRHDRDARAPPPWPAGARPACCPGPPVVLPASRIVATSADVLRSLGDGRALPANLVLITGPSRSGDIEQIMTLGVHGPLAVEIALLRRA